MSTMFDSEVYALRREAPFAMPQLLTLMRAKCEDEASRVALTADFRPDVSSGVWWTLTWTQNGREHRVAAMDLRLLGWRAIHTHKLLEREAELRDQAFPAGPSAAGWTTASSRGFEDGDGV